MGPTFSLPQLDLVPTISSADLARLKSQNPDLWTDPHAECRTCRKQGSYRTILADGTQEVVPCDCVQQWGLYIYLLNAGVGIHYQRLGWQHARGITESVREQVQDYIANAAAYVAQGYGLTFWSSCRGSGKTLLATLVLKSLLAQGYDGYSCLFNQLLTLHTAGWRDADARRWFEYRVANAGVLHVDDMGKENPNRSEVVGALVDEILRTRIANARPTIITTNLSLAELGQRYYSDVISLFAECNEPIEVPGEDYRPQYREEFKKNTAAGIVYPVTVG